MKATLEVSPSPNQTRNIGRNARGRNRPDELHGRLQQEAKRRTHAGEDPQRERRRGGQPEALGDPQERRRRRSRTGCRRAPWRSPPTRRGPGRGQDRGVDDLETRGCRRRPVPRPADARTAARSRDRRARAPGSGEGIGRPVSPAREAQRAVGPEERPRQRVAGLHSCTFATSSLTTRVISLSDRVNSGAKRSR